MFGGHGLFFGRTFFGIMSGGRLYLKTDDATVGEYVRRGKKAFHSGKAEALRAYFELPEDVLNDRERLAEWVREAVRCAMGPRAAEDAAAAAVAFRHGREDAQPRAAGGGAEGADPPPRLPRELARPHA
jgi:DNA transformation protein